MNSVTAQIETQITPLRNLINKHNQRSKKLVKLAEKEQVFHDRLRDRSSNLQFGTPSCRKVSHDLVHNLRYKERKLKRFIVELDSIEDERQSATKKMGELEEMLAEVQANIRASEAATAARENSAPKETAS